MTGIKYDKEKLRFDLIDPFFHADLAEVLSFGAAKYSPNNWQKLEDAGTRYTAAAERHLNAIKRGELNDAETGLPHSSHLACNAMFLHYLQRACKLDQVGVETTTGWASRVLQGTILSCCERCTSDIMPGETFYVVPTTEDEEEWICATCHRHVVETYNDC